ncbi:MAG TPA: DNA polymerase III subunit gamma/tau [Acidimicrobiales bacterium]|nr:DNA polymerase III subunit gamma/tau [Acidimicrobiales bacterium]
MAEENVPYQSLYRRFRPQRFGEVLGQDHVTRALQNAVREGRVGHGYLFSGPRGTGKTSTARILAKALNCEKLDDGEPCGVCESCVSVQQGNSFAVFEMDAASNRGIDAIRDLIQRIALGGPGQRKVYIIDEVHHLTNDAATALLKTLEEPPGHVVFVLATTDPQKVLPTIKSRVQHYEFHLLPTDVLQSLVSNVNEEAGLGLESTDLDRVVRRGAGSARDALSVLDQAAALGAVEDEVPVADEVTEALCERDPARALAAVASACGAGRDPRRMGEEILSHLRDVFLVSRAPDLVDLSPEEKARAEDQGKRLGAASLVRAMERLGESLTDMREALDARVTLEVALVRITAPEADTSVAALLERIERLERRLEGGEVVAAPPAVAAPQAPAPTPVAPVNLSAEAAPVRRSAPKPAPVTPAQVTPPPPPPTRGALGAYRKAAAPSVPPVPSASSVPPGSAEVAASEAPDRDADAAPPAAPVRAAAGGDLPSRDEITLAWGDAVLPGLRGRAKALFAVGRFVTVENGRAVFALPNEAHRTQCLSSQKEVEAALANHFGRPIPLHLVVDDAPGESSGERSGTRNPDPSDDDEVVREFREMREAPSGPSSPADRVKLAFPGAVEVEGS